MPVAPEELRRIDILAGAGQDALAAAASGAGRRTLAAGEWLVRAGEPSTCVFLLMDGELEGYATGGGATEVFTNVHVAPTYLGAMPMLMGVNWGASIRAAGPCELVTVPADAFRALIHGDREVETAVLRASFSVAQLIEARAQDREKLAALGTMAAGLAHELNNPAAAARRTATELSGALAAIEATLGAFVGAGIEREQAAELLELRRAAVERAATAAPLAALERSEREDELADLLEEAEVADAFALAEPLASAGVDAAWLEEVRELAGEATGAVVRWLAATLTARSLVDDLTDSTARISGLVQAVKDYSYMDRGAEQAVDVHHDLASTLKILGYKLKQGSVRVELDLDPALPPVEAFGGQLNQVWTNLIDNAIDAVDGDGTVTVRTRRCDEETIEVQVSDDGPGIPAELRRRIFEPFFTTKAPGRGTGLGLPTVRRIVERHRGELRYDEREGGGTTVRVRLPVAATSPR